MASKDSSSEEAQPESAAGIGTWLLLGVAFVGLGLWIYGPALDGEFISDDQHYIRDNPHIHELSAANLREILNPRSVLTLVVENYAPVHLLLHAAEWKAFGTEVRGYHVVNVVLHALASLLLALFFVRTGIPRIAAIAGAALFLVHSANVEAVAWMSQLKSPAAMVLSVTALLAHRRLPLLGALLFALGLFAKPSALFALPVLLIWEWTSSPEERSPRAWLWVGVWAALFLAFAVVELSAFSETGGYVPPIYAEPLVRLRSGAAIGMRYLAMAATTYGLSTFQEPAPAASWLDLWWLGSLVAMGLMGWRIVHVLLRRRTEALYWAWAAASFSAVSGLLPLPFPMADRYLYSILPGLIGALLCAGGDFGRWIGARAQARGADPAALLVMLTRVAGVAALALVIAFAARSHERSRIWAKGSLVMANSELNYPDGAAAHTRKATRAARIGDSTNAVAHLRAAHERGYNRLDHLLMPHYDAVRDAPGFRALVNDIAQEMIGRLGAKANPSQIELHAMAFAYNAIGDTDNAIRALERGVEVGGPKDAQLAQDLQELNALRERELRFRSR